MQISTVVNSRSATPFTPVAQLLRPLHTRTLRSTSISFSPTLTRETLHRGSRLQFTCSASDQDQQNAENDVRPEVSKTKLADKGAESEVPKLGLPGTIATWALLIVLFGGSLFFTFSRSFLPDMQPLDTQNSELTSKGF